MKVKALIGGTYKDPATGRSIRFRPGEVDLPGPVAEFYLERFQGVIEPLRVVEMKPPVPRSGRAKAEKAGGKE